MGRWEGGGREVARKKEEKENEKRERLASQWMLHVISICIHRAEQHRNGVCECGVDLLLVFSTFCRA